MKDLIERLTQAYGPSGREAQVRALIRDEIRGLVDESSISPLGSLHAILNKGGYSKVMVAAHMDEIGVIVSHIDEKGFARFQGIGGLNPQTLVGHRVRFESGAIGVIGIEDQVDWKKKAVLETLYLDFGSDSSESSPVNVGDIGAFVRPFNEVGRRWVSKAMDDRIGVAIAIEALRRLDQTPNEVQIAFTTQEEVGLHGARTSAYGLDPDLGLAIDVTRTGDTPKGPKMAVALGKGPAIKVRDSWMISDPRVVDLMVQRAEGAGIPHQFEVLEGGSTDASVIQLARSGVPAGCLSIPCRYVHTPSEMVDADDVENCVELMVEILKQPIDFVHAAS